MNIDENSYPEETELNTNPSLTLAQTRWAQFWPFYFLSLLRHYDF